MGRRIRWLGLVLVLAFAVVLAQLVNIQMREATALNNATANPRKHAKTVDNQRGVILAAGGAVLASSVKVPNPAAGQPEWYRQYATGSLYSGIVGYSSSYYGTSGAEYVYNTYLSLHTQSAQSLNQILNPPAATTDSVTLTVVPSLQQLARQQLATIPDTNKDGAVVVTNVRTGAILAMYSSPTYTNNPLATPDQTKQKAAYQADTAPDHEGYVAYPPMATWDRFAPGSTFKVVTSTAVYNLKPTLAGFTFTVSGCTGKNAIPFTTHQICNDATTPTAADPCGGMLAQMLPESCDPGFAMLGLHLGGTTLYQQATLFGYDATPPVDEHPVQKSNFPLPATFKTTGRLGPAGVAQSAFGQQTVSSTALQGAMVAQAIANTGVELDPHVMSQIRSASGALVKAYPKTVYKQAATASAAQSVNKLMQGVVTDGTASGVGFPATEDVAVKTGTAQAGPGNDQTVDWMIGFAPANNPRVAISVVAPYQPLSTSGAEIAGPIVKNMLAAALAVVPPNATAPPTAPPTSSPKPVYTNTGTYGPTTTTTTPPPPTTTPTTAPPSPTTAPPAVTTPTDPATPHSAADVEGAGTFRLSAFAGPLSGAARPPTATATGGASSTASTPQASAFSLDAMSARHRHHGVTVGRASGRLKSDA